MTVRSVQSIYNHDAEHGKFSSSFQIMFGIAGKQLVLDTEGNSLEEVDITLSDDRNTASKSLIIDVEYPEAGSNPIRHSVVSFLLNRQTLTIEKRPSFEEGLNMPRYYEYVIMPEAYQIHLFNTINSLMPGAPTITTQLESRDSKEQATPLKLPAPKRGARRT